MGGPDSEPERHVDSGCNDAHLAREKSFTALIQGAAPGERLDGAAITGKLPDL